MNVAAVPQRLPDPTQHRYRVAVAERRPLLARPLEQQYATPHIESLHTLTWRMSDGSEMSELETAELIELRRALEAAAERQSWWTRCKDAMRAWVCL